jgi:hypothetical protein
MDKVKIIVAGAGGSASTNFVRSLRLVPKKFHIIGVDCNKFYLQRAETDERYLVPRADDSKYIPTLNKIICKTKAEFIHAQNDLEVATLAQKRQQLSCKTFLPSTKTVKICQNKWLSRQIWEAWGIEKPLTFLITNNQVFEEAWKQFNGGTVWLRDIKGAGGKGSLKTNSKKESIDWLHYNKGWGHYTMAEYLSERSTTFTTIYKDGLLVAGQGRKRLYWELGPAFISGVSGATGGGAVDNDPIVADMAIKAVSVIDSNPNGIYSVDLTYGQDGLPYPTEINIGRFFTTHLFFARAGFNMAYIYTRIGLGEEVPLYAINPLKEGLVWIRGMDFEPILTTMDKINASNVDLSDNHA